MESTIYYPTIKIFNVKLLKDKILNNYFKYSSI